MRILAGGFGLQGAGAIPFLNASEKIFEDAQIIASGIAGFYAILREIKGKDYAFMHTIKLLRKFVKEFYIVDRAPICEGRRIKGWKRLAVDYCVNYAIRDGIREYSEVFEIFEENIENATIKNVSIEVFDLKEKSVRLISNEKAKVLLSATLSFPGIFPAFEGRYISTVYLTQIVVESAKEDDMVFVNFRDPSLCKIKTADEELAHVAELRAIYYAKKRIERKKLKKVIKGELLLWRKFFTHPDSILKLEKIYEERIKEVIKD